MRDVAVAGDLDRLESLEERPARPPRHPRRGLDDVVAGERRDRDRQRVAQPEPVGQVDEVPLDRAEARLVEVHEVHLVDREDDVGDAEHRRDGGVPVGLLDHALAGVEQDDRDVGGRGAGDHVARVLDVPGRVGELEAARRGDEGAVGDVDRDPLLPLGAEPVGEERQVDVAVAAALARLLDVLELVGHDLLRVVEQAPDERRLAVVDRAARDEAQELARGGLAGEQLREVDRPIRSSRSASGPPSRPRDTLSSARVSPRSVMRVAAISRTTSGIVAAVERTPPVQLMSPTVRKRTHSENGSSWG